MLWYLIDRSRPGFVISAVVGIAGTAILLGVNPEIVPSPAGAAASSSMPSPSQAMRRLANGSYSSAEEERIGNGGGGLGMMMGLMMMMTNESIGVGTWIASVLFCSCLCFGNVGRRLVGGRRRKRR